MLIDNAQDNAAANAELMKLVHASCATIEDLRTAIDALKTEVDAAHTMASRVASTEAIALLALIAMSAWSVGQITVSGGGTWRKSRG
jgi:hypothetical protein